MSEFCADFIVYMTQYEIPIHFEQTAKKNIGIWYVLLFYAWYREDSTRCHWWPQFRQILNKFTLFQTLKCACRWIAHTTQNIMKILLDNTRCPCRHQFPQILNDFTFFRTLKCASPWIAQSRNVFIRYKLLHYVIFEMIPLSNRFRKNMKNV